MHKQTFLVLYRYNAWSNARILKAASPLTPEQFQAPAFFPHGGLQSTLLHAFFAEWLWRQRWEGTAPDPTFRFDPQAFPTVEALQMRWQEEEGKLMNFVTNLSEADLSRPIKYVSTEGFAHERRLWEGMAHLVNHGTQHKTEAAAILTALGHSPGDIDLIVYLNEGH